MCYAIAMLAVSITLTRSLNHLCCDDRFTPEKIATITALIPQVLHQEGTVCIKIGLLCNPTAWYDAFVEAGLTVEAPRIITDALSWQLSRACTKEAVQRMDRRMNVAHMWIVAHIKKRGWYYKAPTTPRTHT